MILAPWSFIIFVTLQGVGHGHARHHFIVDSQEQRIDNVLECLAATDAMVHKISYYTRRIRDIKSTCFQRKTTET